MQIRNVSSKVTGSIRSELKIEKKKKIKQETEDHNRKSLNSWRVCECNPVERGTSSVMR